MICICYYHVWSRTLEIIEEKLKKSRKQRKSMQKFEAMNNLKGIRKKTVIHSEQ